MPRTLILLRHTKSDWQAGVDDHERPLNPRGQRAAAVMGVYLNQEGLSPDLVLASTALRTRETCRHLLHHAGLATQPTFDRSLYLAKPDQILDAVRQHGEEARCILVVAHNPGLQELAVTLARRSNAELAEALHARFPTGGMVVCKTSETWARSGLDSLQVAQFTYPKALV